MHEGRPARRDPHDDWWPLLSDDFNGDGLPDLVTVAFPSLLLMTWDEAAASPAVDSCPRGGRTDVAADRCTLGSLVNSRDFRLARGLPRQGSS